MISKATIFSLRGIRPVNMKKTDEAMKGHVFTSPGTYQKYLLENQGKEPVYVLVNGTVYTLNKADHYAENELGLHKYARQALRISLTDELDVQLLKPPQNQEYRLAQLEIELDILQMANNISGKLEVDDEDLSQRIRKIYTSQFFKVTQMIILDYQGNILVGKVIRTGQMQLGIEAKVKTTPMTFEYGGMLIDETSIDFTIKAGNNLMKLKSAGQKTRSLFAEDFSFEKMGVGGLDQELANIFRRAFASRRFPPAFLDQYGIQHVKGMLLYGPPGTGKTLIARQLASVLKAKEPKIVNGPEIFSKYVGEAEENIRKLFKEAIEDQSALGDESPLHIIVLDEMDAICKQRGTINSGAGAYDNVVNQLLSMIDGVNSLSNILVIGMTNRKDLIDEAVLRPGRLEVHIEVGLPDEKGRQQILMIHTEKIRKNNALDPGVDLPWLAAQMKNYTGAEIQATVKSAQSFAFNRISSVFDFNKKVQTSKDEFKVTMQDFESALGEVKPQFGMDTNKFDCFLRNPLINYGTKFEKIQKILQNSIEQTKNGKNSQLNSILLEGDVGCGKTSIAAWAAIQCGFPYVKLISPENFVGYTEGAIINQIMKVFNDAYKSPNSCIVIDNIERIIEYVDIGPRFSNNILQALLVLIKKLPDKEKNRLLIIGTTSQAKILKDLEVLMCFNLTVKVHNLVDPTEIMKVLETYNNNQYVNASIAKSVSNLPIKRLLMILDMASHGQNDLDYEKFMECYESVEMSAY